MLFSQILNVSLVSSVNITFSAGFLLILRIYFFNSWSNLFNRFFVENTKQFYSAWFQPLLKLVLIFVKNFASPSLCCRLFFWNFCRFFLWVCVFSAIFLVFVSVFSFIFIFSLFFVIFSSHAPVFFFNHGCGFFFLVFFRFDFGLLFVLLIVDTFEM